MVFLSVQALPQIILEKHALDMVLHTSWTASY
jgi:hypothetical protein